MSDITVTAKIDNGVSLAHADGRKLQLAVVDENGRVIQSGQAVARAVFSAAVTAYDNFWSGNGHLSTVLRIESK